MDRLPVVALAVAVAALALLWASLRLRQRAGMPPGRVVYSDTGSWRACVDPLYAPSVNLSGKPDYLVQRWNHVIPVEVKSGDAPAEPYRSHVMQLAAYCLLVEAAYGRRPPYGLIHYDGEHPASTRTFAVRYTRELEDALLDTIEWMRQDLREGHADRSHDDPARCRACGYADHCDQRLG
ncbi:MAG: Dna2/Cas4 domain-containing protein [Anaerolineae bacterium]|nr:Dna2/Cas4 domain-containing protein [Anaerolineae bacterium]